jgi:iron complex transport system ATP-binding protein
MKNGRVVHFGHTAEIMTGEILSEVFRTAVQVIDGPDGPLAVYY